MKYRWSLSYIYQDVYGLSVVTEKLTFKILNIFGE